jgi:hypothetical protein
VHQDTHIQFPDRIPQLPAFLGDKAWFYGVIELFHVPTKLYRWLPELNTDLVLNRPGDGRTEGFRSLYRGVPESGLGFLPLGYCRLSDLEKEAV